MASLPLHLQPAGHPDRHGRATRTRGDLPSGPSCGRERAWADDLAAAEAREIKQQPETAGDDAGAEEAATGIIEALWRVGYDR